ncbi:MAG TPA: ankyrin repeat domain-containing protein [Pyrinomonadaceae bacterium]|nr:ankyrin repeat domain-containing protein [Pyrinomonadaceae bacterium]
MSAKLRKVNLPAVTAELLCVAESGDVDEVLRLLPRVVDINARNRHGMTALMKAAFFGHEPVVRVLLEHGADPNLMRNDSFTALALAAFFGHVETVKTLIEFGARTEAVTRAGASARAWARARTYEEVARCLETHAPPQKPVPVPIAIARIPLPVEDAPVTPIVVKTLSEPPEIWDLVHEAPRDFDPRSAFISRLTSTRKMFVLGACALVFLIGGCVVGVLMLRSSHARGLQPSAVAPAPVAPETTVSQPVQPEAVVESAPVEVVNANHARAVPNKARRQQRTAPVANEPPAENVATAVATPEVELPKPSPPVVKTNPSTALSPNVITPAKSTPPKGKVIQWP